MQKLILDYAKWRCGGDHNIFDELNEYPQKNKNALGQGSTTMHNDEGFECCLGQFSPQLNPEIDQYDITFGATPVRITQHRGKLIPFLVEEHRYYNLQNTKLAKSAMEINDSHKTTPDEKIKLLKELFKPVGFEIEVINKP